MIDQNYLPPNQSNWTGRAAPVELGNQYYYQAIELLNINRQKLSSKRAQKTIGLLGYSCEEGVRRNQGRIGAATGPEKIRKSLGRLAFHASDKSILDFGDIVCDGKEMEMCQQHFSQTISSLIDNGIIPIGLGGGHDIAFAHYMGIEKALSNSEKKSIAIINFDAHFDLRPLDKQGNSGTPFNQISNLCKRNNEDFSYLVIGIQQQSNTRELFDIVDRLGVQYVHHRECHLSNFDGIKKQLDSIITKSDHIYISIDLDGFSSAYAPGVSAPSPLGFTPFFFFKVLQYILKTSKVISFDIAELNPIYDQDNVTAKLAAMIVDFIVMNISVENAVIE